MKPKVGFIKMRKLPKIKLKGKIQLNLGCGYKPEKGYIGIDIRDCGQEVIWDIREGIPFPDNSVDMVWSQHVLEHLTNDEAKALLLEIYRVLKIGGKTLHVVPHAADPTSCYFDHESFWNEQKIDTAVRIPGLEGFEITRNHSGNKNIIKELFFELIKVK